MPKILGDVRLYDVEELGRLLDINTRTLRQLLREGKLKGRKLARKWYISEDAIKDYFSQPEPEPGDDDEEENSGSVASPKEVAKYAGQFDSAPEPGPTR